MNARTTFAILVLSLVVSGAAFGTSVMLPRTTKELATVWIGVSNDQQQTYRLQLDSKGQGTLVILDWLPQTYRITSTRLSEFAISFEVTPVGKSTEPLAVSGTAYGVLRLSLQTSDARQDITLIPYENFMKRLDTLNKSAAMISKAK
jgi:hypothetical protein